MTRENLDALVVPTDDPHGSDYLAEHWQCRKWLTGFTGSAGTCVVTLNSAGLWTDGRYFLQAEKELEGSTIDLYRSLEPGVPSIFEFLNQMNLVSLINLYH